MWRKARISGYPWRWQQGENFEVSEESEGSPSTSSYSILEPLVPGEYIGNLPRESREAIHMKRKLSKFLDFNHNNTSGEYVRHSVTEVPVNPGLQIQDYGLVGLPITDKMATSLLQYHRALNKTSDGDLAVFGERDIDFINNQWTSASESALTTFTEVLYPGSEITTLVNPRFLLCTSDSDLDTASSRFRSPDVLGTCMFTLPSVHQGYRIELTNETGRETLSSGARDCFSSLGVAWLRDTKARLSGLARGCFAALIYDIDNTYRRRDQSSTARQIHKRTMRLRGLVAEWFEATTDIIGTATSLAYRLPNLYNNEEQLTIGKLDPCDRALIRILDKACDGTPYTICLASMTRTITEDVCGDPENKVECPSKGIDYFAIDSTRLVMVSDLQGHVIAKNAEFDKTWLVQDDVYEKDREPNLDDDERDENDPVHSEEEFEEGPRRHQYDDTVVLILTQKDLVNLLVCHGLSSEAERAKSIQEAHKRCKNEPDDRAKSLFLQALCRRMLDKVEEEMEKEKKRAHSDYRISNSFYNPIIAAGAAQKPKQDVLFHIIDAIAEQPKEATIVEILRKAIEMLEITQEEDLDKIIGILTVIDFEPIAYSLNQPFRRILQLKDRHERIQALERRCLQSVPSAHPQLRDWAAEHLAEFYRLRSQSDINVVVDAQLLAQLALSYRNSFMDVFLAPGIGIDCCEALLRGLLRIQKSDADADAFVKAQIPAIVQTLITLLKSGEICVRTPIAKLIVDASTLDTGLCNALVSAMLDSPAMRSRQGGTSTTSIPAVFENQLQDIIELQAAGIPPDHRSIIAGLLESLATNFYVFQVGRPPQKYPNLQRMPCLCLWHSPQGQEVNRFLQDPQAGEFISVAWDSRTRDDIMRLLQSEDRDLTVRIDKVRPKSYGMYQMHLRKVDRVWEKAWDIWCGRRSQYLGMLNQPVNQSFLQGDRHQFLRIEDLQIMESRVLPQDGPLYPNKYFIWSLSPTTTPAELTAMIEKQGGRVVSIEEIDGPDVIGINASSAAPLNFAGSPLRYWQPRIVSEDEMLRVLRECQEKASTVDGKRKVDNMDHDPLTEDANSDGPNKRRKTHDDGVEIIDLVDD